nr:titin isoform X1 [Megalopta genalis]
MESDQRGRASRASSTSSLGREVRCGCQYYQSDSLLPERRALISRPPSRTMQQPPAVRCSEHEYEPIAAPSPKPAVAPVVRITDTDVVPVADSDDSIDDRGRLPPELTQAGDVRLPLDGKIEDSAMEGRELVETGDTSEEIETPQQLQDRLEERFLSTATPGAESRTDAEVNTSQVDSLALEELPLRRGARGLPQRLKSQAGKLRSRLKNIHRPSFPFADRPKPEKVKSSVSSRSDRSRSERRPSRMERIRSSFSERPRFSLPDRPRFSLPDRSAFHLPERPKFNIKKPNIRLPNALTRAKKTPSDEQPSTESAGSRKNIFHFATYPRIFDKKSKAKPEYATSTPKDSRAQSAENATFPRTRKRRPSWAQRFEETTPYIDDDDDRPNTETAVQRSRPWRHPSIEDPRLSISMTEEGLAGLPWEEKRRLEQIRYMDYEESTERSDRQDAPRSETPRTEEESYERERAELEQRYKDTKKDIEEEVEEDWIPEEEPIEEFKPIPRSRSLEEMMRARQDGRFEGFATVDPRRYGVHKTPSEEEEEEYDDEMEEEEEPEASSAQSDREQQHSSGSSCDRRRRGVIEEIDFDVYFVQAGGIRPEDLNLRKYLTHEIRDDLGAGAGNALADEDLVPVPPARLNRNRALRKRLKEEFFEEKPPVRPERDPNRVRRSESADEQFRERTRSDSRHRIVYQAEGLQDVPLEPLDDIVVVKPVRRKSKSSQRSQSQGPLEPPRPPSPTPPPPVVPTRRKRSRKDPFATEERINGEPICNGHREWAEADGARGKSLPPVSTEHLLAEEEVYTAEEILAASVDNIEMRLREEEEYIPPVPVPPKRRSRSRGTSVAQDEDRTSHGAESLPEAGYVEEDIPPDDMDYGRDLSGYAIIEKREKPPRPPPPRRKKDKFATAPKPVPPKRPLRAYSTLGPGRTKDTEMLSETFVVGLEPTESAPYIEIDSDGGEHKDLRSTEVLSKMQRRPLPAPPRPPRTRKEKSLDRSVPLSQDFSMETTTATQTDPLPDDMIIEEEVTQAKLVVAPSSSGSQIMVSTERIPTPLSITAPPVPPLPLPQRSRKEDIPGSGFETVSLKAPSPARELESLEDRHLSAPDLEPSRETMTRDEEALIRSIRSALLSDEPVRISNLEVGDLRVDRLSVSQIDAGKIVASEVDALVVTTSELKNIGAGLEESLSPSIVKELIAIRSHLETVAAARAQEDSVERKTAVAEAKADIPVTERQSAPREPEDPASIRQRSPEDADRPASIEDQKVVNREIVEPGDSMSSITHTLTVAQVEVRELPVTHHTLTVSRVGPRDGAIHTPSSQSPQALENVEDKQLRISDSETPLSLSSATAKQPTVEESRPPPLSSTETTGEKTWEERVEATDSVPPPEFERLDAEPKDKEGSPDLIPPKRRKSRSRSPSPISISRTRQTASPVRSLPPAISVTPDTPDTVTSHGHGHGISSNEVQPQRAVISYSSYRELSDRESHRESSMSPTPSFPLGGTHLIAFPVSDVPAHFLSLTNHRQSSVEPSVTDSVRQLIRVLRVAVLKWTRRFVDHLSSVVGVDEAREKVRELELVLCALMVLIAGMLIFFFSNTRSVTHHHHWDYFNPPK